MREITAGRLCARMSALKDTPAFPHTPDIQVKRAAADKATDYWEPLFTQAIEVIDALVHQYNSGCLNPLEDELQAVIADLHLPLDKS